MSAKDTAFVRDNIQDLLAINKYFADSGRSTPTWAIEKFRRNFEGDRLAPWGLAETVRQLRRFRENGLTDNNALELIKDCIKLHDQLIAIRATELEPKAYREKQVAAKERGALLAKRYESLLRKHSLIEFRPSTWEEFVPSLLHHELTADERINN